MKLVYTLVFSFGAICMVHAQSYYRIKNISVEDGLSQSSTRSIIQDDRGFLWIGTNDGLNRYDGKTFKIYRATDGDSTALPSSYISCLRRGPDGRLWIGYAGGISIYNFESDNFENFTITLPFIASPPLVFDIEFLSKDEFLIGTEVGMFHFNLKNKSFYIGKDDNILQHKIVRSIYQSKLLGLCVATSGGLFTKLYGHSEWKHYSNLQGLSNNYVYCIYEDSTVLLAGTANGVDVYDKEKDSFILFSETKEKTKGFVQSITRDFEGNIWIGAQGITVLDKNYKSIQIVATNPNPINAWLTSISETTAIYQTKDSSIWVGKGSGLLQYIGTTTFNTIPIATENVASGMMTIFSVYTEDDNRLFIGSINGLYEINLTNRKVAWHFSASSNQPNRHSLITSIFKNRKGVMWLGTGNGLIRFSGEEKNSITLFKGNVGEENQVIDIAELNDSMLVMTIQQKGLWFLNQQTGKIVKKISFDSRAMLLSGNLLYVGSANRIKVFDTAGNLLRESNPLPTYTRRITEIFKDGKEVIWIATEGSGFHKWNMEQDNFESYSIKQGLGNPVVYCMLEDKTGKLWLSTNNGISVFNPATKMFINFGIEDGLQATEFNTGAAFKSPNGVMYFGGIRGLNYFVPEKLLVEVGTVDTYITSIFVNNKPIQSGISDKNIFLLDEIDLSYKENNIAFQLTSLDYIHPHRIRYQYRLDNFSNEWLDPIEKNFISFTNLPSGDYTLNIRSSTGNGAWKLTPTAFQIHIHAPFWYKRSFQVIAFLAFTLFGFIYYKLRVRRLKETKKRLESIVRQRTKEIQQQKEEIASQNEELTSHTEVMALKNIELEAKTRAMEELTHMLEDKVEERTKKLNLMNRDLMEQNIRLEQFSFITAHNLRGPIASIKGLLNIFPKTENAESKELLKRIDGCSDRLFEIVNDLSLVLGIRSGSQTAIEPIQLKKELLIAIESLRNDLVSKNVLIDYSDFNESATIAGVKAYVHSIFYNLIHNAIKYSSDREQPKIMISCIVESGKVKIMIHDNGIGIDMKYAEGKVFQLYQRFNTHTQGKGLGLFLVKNEVDTMGGSIWLESGLNQGTTFFIEFDEYTNSKSEKLSITF